MKIDYDDFIRTTEPRHTKIVEKVFDMLMEKEIYTFQSMKGGIVNLVKLILHKPS